MSKLVLNLSVDLMSDLMLIARKANKTPEELGREILKAWVGGTPLNPPDGAINPESEDVLGYDSARVQLFLTAATEPGEGVRAKALYEAYVAWFKAQKLEPRYLATNTAFGLALGKLGTAKRKLAGGTVYTELALKTPSPC